MGVVSSGVSLSLLVLVKRTLNAPAYRGILDNFMLLTLWEQFGVRSVKTCVKEFAQSLDLKPDRRPFG